MNPDIARRWSVTAAALGTLVLAAPGLADTLSDSAQRAQKLAVEVCSSCHGPGGVSISPTFPDLAGQNKDYLVAQLTAFREHRRGEQAAHDFMYGMARSLDDSTIHALAEFFSAEKPAPGHPGSPAIIAKGQAIYDKGDPSRGIVACSTCHGPEGKGSGPIPRLAGQHSDYVLKQLLVIQNALRSVPAMHGIVQSLKSDEMEAVAAYVQSLN